MAKTLQVVGSRAEYQGQVCLHPEPWFSPNGFRQGRRPRYAALRFSSRMYEMGRNTLLGAGPLPLALPISQSPYQADERGQGGNGILIQSVVSLSCSLPTSWNRDPPCQEAVRDCSTFPTPKSWLERFPEPISFALMSWPNREWVSKHFLK